MGCPDWPKCFGEYIPPTSVAELPADYEQKFLNERVEKNQRLVRLLNTLGLSGLSKRIENDPRVLETEPFSPAKAWVEYVNRLIGVLIGFLVLLNAIWSLQFWNKHRAVSIVGICVLILTIFQGWVGSLVVSTNLLPGFITFHMLLALLIVVLLIWMRQMSLTDHALMGNTALKWIVGIFFILLIPQVTAGTMTREQVDMLLAEGVARSELVSALEGSYFVHRSYSWILLIVAVLAGWKLRKNGHFNWANILIAAVLLEVVLGVALAYGGMPVFIQPFHLITATLLFGAVFYLFLRIKIVQK